MIGMAAVLSLFLQIGPAGGGDATRETFSPLLKFSAVDKRERIEARLGRDLVVRVKQVATGTGFRFGWEVEAVDRRLRNSPNFLESRRRGHGPAGTDLFAWHFAGSGWEPYRPSQTRRLLVYGYPYELEVRFVDVVIEEDRAWTPRDGSSAHFVRGTIGVYARKLGRSNPLQVGIP